MPQPIPDLEFATIVRHAPLVAIDVVVEDDIGCVLLGRRANEPARGTYFVPGGRIRKDETFAAAFQRIVRSEIGLEADIANALFIGVLEHFYTTNYLEREGFGTHYVVLAFRLRVPTRPAIIGDDQHDAFIWRSVSELKRDAAVHSQTKAYFAAEGRRLT